MDLIERQAAIDRVLATGYADQIKDNILLILRLLPSAQPERKKGKWINHRNDNGHNIADCDKCGEAMQWFDDDIKPNYCPNCGADMRDQP